METSIADKIFVRTLFEGHLLVGDPTVITDINIRALNAIAMRLYNESQLNEDDIECLKYLLLICNLLYNRTDLEVLPIEDGVYDLLLEKYKVYDKEFQVGSAVVEFKSMIQREPGFVEPENPIIYHKPMEKPKDEISGLVRESIMLNEYNSRPPVNFYNTIQSPIYYDSTGMTKRTRDTQHNHPSLVGTLDKCKFVFMVDAIKAGCADDPNVKILERDFFAKHINAGIIRANQKLEIVLELKYDGISVEADCTNVVESARTRGDTGIGVATDITPILKGYPFKHASCMIGQEPVGVKFEAIMTRSQLYNFNIARGKSYANCRTAIIGLFGNLDAPLFRDFITLIPLAIDRDDIPQIPNRGVEILYLNDVFISNGEPLRHCIITGTPDECLFYIKKYLEEAKLARDYLNFAYDGIVVSYMDEGIRAKLGRENFINKYSMAVKFDPMSKITTFRGYTFEVGQNGNITPMIHYDPVEFYGTIHTKCSGASLARFLELNLAYGDHIEVTYRNDVMPYVTKPDCEYNRNNPNPAIEPPSLCPVCGTLLEVSNSGKNLVCTNIECKGRKISRVANMLAKMNLKGFGEQMIEAIDKYTLRDLVNLDIEYLAPRIGAGNAKNFVELMNRLKTEPIYDYLIVGSLGFTGIASKKWQIIFQNMTLIDIINAYTNGVLEEALLCKNGIGPATIDIINDEMEFYIDDLIYITSMKNVVNSFGVKAKKQIRFSGCRDQQIEQLLINDGYDADSSLGVTKKTDILLIPYEGYTSTKTKKMTGEGQMIVPITDFVANMSKYL
ncbi:MAG: hypothetical protein NC548_15785 [Lachnospiraceae bacterium]|nr:hypothetical protein [Lachnospiraceae bacterium]